MQAWYQTLGETSAVLLEEILRAFARQGLTLTAEVLPSGPGVAFFTRVDPAVLAGIHLLRRRHQGEFVAVGLGPALPDQEIWLLLHAGAGDVLCWHQLQEPAAAVAARLHRWRYLNDILTSPLVRRHLAGKSSLWLKVMREAAEAARFSEAPVLLVGETGSGKEILARLIHTLDPRDPKGHLVILDCATIVPDLSGSEFFGHEKGAFTGAVAPREGAFSLADGGTLFLDEVSELPPPLQAQLLRVLQEGMYKRVGGNVWHKTRFRLVSASNRDLREEVAAGRFRQDLYHRLASLVITIPPLRERPEDVLPLAEHFLREFHPQGEAPVMSEGLRRYLLQRPYPGNVRELRQLILRLLCRYPGNGPLTLGLIPEEERPPAFPSAQAWCGPEFEMAVRRAVLSGVGLREMKNRLTETAIRLALEETRGNTQAAAACLGVTPRLLQIRTAAARRQLQGPESA